MASRNNTRQTKHELNLRNKHGITLTRRMNTLRGDHFDLETFERETEYDEMDFSPNLLAVIELSNKQ